MVGAEVAVTGAEVGASLEEGAVVGASVDAGTVGAGTVVAGAVGGGVEYHVITPATPRSRFGTFSTGVPNCSVVPTDSVKRAGTAPLTVTP